MADYVFAEVAAPEGAPLLVLLHGTGGSETDLIDIGRTLMPEARLVSPRGDVSEGGAPRFFRRLGMGVYDMADLARATDKLAGFIAAQAKAHAASRVAALGYSNGANVLASVLFAQPGLVDRAVLLHPLIPFVPPEQSGLAGRQVLLTAGRRDPICPPSETERLLAYFKAQGADVEVAWHEGGHELKASEIEAAKAFLKG